jgi:hypothetical protein
MEMQNEPRAAVACEPPMVGICVEQRCSCVPSSMPPATSPPRQECSVAITYDIAKPDLPSLQFSSGSCAMNAEIAMAFALAALLRVSGPLIPMPKVPAPR